MADWKENNERIQQARVDRVAGRRCDICISIELVGFLTGLACPKCGGVFDTSTK